MGIIEFSGKKGLISYLKNCSLPFIEVFQINKNNMNNDTKYDETVKFRTLPPPFESSFYIILIDLIRIGILMEIIWNSEIVDLQTISSENDLINQLN